MLLQRTICATGPTRGVPESSSAWAKRERWNPGTLVAFDCLADDRLAGILRVATQAASHLLIAEIKGESARRDLAAYLLNAVAPSVLDRTLSSGDIDATQLADAARQVVRGITGAAQKP